MKQHECHVCHSTEFPYSDGVFSGEGLKCPSCASREVPLPAGEPHAAQDPMPQSLQLVVGLMALGILVNLIALNLVSVALSGALLLGIVVGNDGVRRFVIALAWINIALNVFLLVLTQSLDVAIMAAFIANGATLWALGRDEVRTWMFNRAFRNGL